MRNLGTIGGSLAHADPSGDLGSVMLAMGGSVVLRKTGGEREVPVKDFIVGTFQTTIEPDEMLTEVRVPKPGPRSGGTYLKLERKVGDYATVAAAICLTLDDGSIGGRRRRTHLGRSLTNLKADAAEAVLRGAAPGDEVVRRGRTSRRGGLEPRDRRPRLRDVQASHGGCLRAPRSRARVRDGRRGLSGEDHGMQVTLSINGTERTIDVRAPEAPGPRRSGRMRR